MSPVTSGTGSAQGWMSTECLEDLLSPLLTSHAAPLSLHPSIWALPRAWWVWGNEAGPLECLSLDWERASGLAGMPMKFCDKILTINNNMTLHNLDTNIFK